MRHLLTLLSIVVAGAALAQNALVVKDQVKIVENLGGQVPLDVKFKDEEGKDVKIGDFFGKRPVALILVFYRCGGTCTKELEEAVRSFKAMKTYDIGREFEVVTVSIHPKEGKELAQLKDDIYASTYSRPTGRAGWHFLTGNEENIRKVSEAVGFKFIYKENDPSTRSDDIVQHPNSLIILTPQGKISQYFNGLVYPQRLVLTALQRAAKGEIGVSDPNEPTGCVLIPSRGKYTTLVENMLRVGGTLFVIGMGGAIFVMTRRSKAAAIAPKEDDSS
ncbi:MAG: SCO family protein [Fimbriimonadaceae bacterium]